MSDDGLSYEYDDLEIDNDEWWAAQELANDLRELEAKELRHQAED